MKTPIHSKQDHVISSRFKLYTLAVMTGLAVGLPQMSGADDKLCANMTYTSPVMNGVIAGDPGWRGSNLYVFNNGTDAPHATVRMIRDSGAYYLGFEVNNDPSFDLEDIFVITLAPTASAPTHRRIHIKPFAENVGSATSTPGTPPNIVDYWTNSSTWNTAPASTTPDWLTRNSDGSCKNICVTSSSSGVPMKSYYVEIRIPISTDPNLGVDLPFSGDFGLYANIIRVTPTAFGSLTKVGLGELRWPSTAPPIGNINTAHALVEASTPAFSAWGQSSLVGPCSGISVVRSFTNNANNRLIDVDSINNIFSVELQNTGSAAGKGVTAQLRSASFGLPGPADFEMYPPSSPWRAPMGPSGVINPGGVVTLSTPAWNMVTDPNRGTYSLACSRIDLSTSPTGGSTLSTLISNSITYHNMHFGTASRFENTATLGTRGYEKPSDGSNFQQFYLLVGAERDSEIFDKPWLSREQFSKDTLAQLMEPSYREKKKTFFRKTVCGYRQTGNKVIIGKTTVNMLESANCYGYLVGHEGILTGWSDRMEGRDGGVLKQLGDSGNSYLATVEHGKSMGLSSVIESIEGGQKPPKPPCPCGTVCPKLASSDTDAISGSLLLVGSLGIGGFAFLRRKRKQVESVVVNERTED